MKEQEKKSKLDIHWSEPIEKTLQKIDEYFSNEENRQEFLMFMEEESKKPCFTHLNCLEMWCEHNKPDNADMGTITWCDKYLNGQEELCEKECGKRTYYESIFGEMEEE